MRTVAALLVWLACAAPLAAQDDPHAGMQMPMDMPMATHHGWTLMQDGVVFVMVDDQGSPRGGTEVRAPNWWMGMGTHRLHRGTLTVKLMLSLDPATVGSHGYGEIFQIGETYHGAPLIDRQHPHDFLMQAAAIWREPIGRDVALTLAGAPVGEPALGPTAFMHRASALDIPVAPLGHHTMDSTHIAMGVLTAGLDRGPFQVETSLFRGAEPDENRWNLMDPGPLDSWSARAWYRPSPAWSFQVSHGFLKKPEALEAGNVGLTTVSGAWKRERSGGFTAATLVWGHNQKISGHYNALLGELTDVRGRTTLFTRLEDTAVEETALGGPAGRIPMVGALTGGAARTVWRPRGFDVAAAVEATTYKVPSDLTPLYGAHPWSFQFFAIIRPPGHRMLDMTMTLPHR